MLGVLLGITGCSVFVDTNGLTGGEDSGTADSSSDSGTVNPLDASGTSPMQSDEAGSSQGDDVSVPDTESGDGGGSLNEDAGDAGEPSSDDAGDGGGPSSEDAGEDSGGSSCGPTDTTANCGTCGADCDTTTGSPSCNGTTCSYACNAGLIDCDGNQAPDTDGCECATPACCGASCQTTHTDGVGQSFYDCNALGTDSQDEAMEACHAYAASIGVPTSDCTGNWVCSGQPSQVCIDFSGNSATEYCWGYGGTMGVYPNYCPSSQEGSWN